MAREELLIHLKKLENELSKAQQRLNRTRAEGDLRENSGYEQAMNDVHVSQIRIRELKKEIFVCESRSMKQESREESHGF